MNRNDERRLEISELNRPDSLIQSPRSVAALSEIMRDLEERAQAEGLRREPEISRIPETIRKLIDAKMPEQYALYADGSRFADKLNIGDPTNYTEIKTDGEINLHGTARVYKQIWIQAEAIRAPGSNPAAFADLGISGAWQFADNLVKVVICKLPLTTDIDTSEDAYIYLGWSSPTISEVCRWQVEYLVRTLNEDLSAAADDTLTQDENSSATANGLTIASFTLPATAWSSADNCLLLRISRMGNHANDTLGDVANLSGVCLHHVSDSLGTALM